MKTLHKTLILSLLLAIVVSCTWVNENKSGRSVKVTNIDSVGECIKVGNIAAEVKYKIGFITRSKEKVIDELKVLARNEALKLKANTIVADGKPLEGQQRFQAFNCP